jgi:hypothetical protein
LDVLSTFSDNNFVKIVRYFLRFIKKVGDDLEVALEEDVIIFDNYFAVCATDLSCLVSLPTEDGGLYHIALYFVVLPLVFVFLFARLPLCDFFLNLIYR